MAGDGGSLYRNVFHHFSAIVCVICADFVGMTPAPRKILQPLGLQFFGFAGK
jgi:hypothetical protein